MRATLVCGILMLFVSCDRETIEPLVGQSQIVGDSIPEPLEARIGDAVAGKQVFVSRESGHCILCHTIKGLDEEFQGNLGTDLTQIGNKLTKGQLRLRIADINYLFPWIPMPSYYRIHDLNQVGNQYKMQPILTAQEIEDLVAFLTEQKS